MTFNTSRRFFGFVLLLVLLEGMALSSCGQQNNSTTEQNQNAPEAQTGGDAQRGEALFTSTGCVACHTTTADQLVGPGMAGIMDGKGPYGAALPNGKPLTDENLVEWIKVGGIGKIGQMPGNPTLTDQQIADLIAYIKTLK